MLRVVQLEELEALLLEAPEVIGRYEQRTPQFRGAVRDWLDRVAAALRSNRLAGAATVAALRGDIIAAERGSPPADLVTAAGASRRQIAATVAMRSLQRAIAAVRAEIDGTRARSNDAHLVARAGLAVARAKSVVNAAKAGNPSIPLPARLLVALESDAELKPMAAHLVGLGGRADALVLFDRGLGEVEGSEDALA